MTNNFRALCAELVDAWLKGDDIVGAMNRARVALADEPAVPDGREPAAVTGQPSDEEVERRFQAWWHDEGSGMPPCADEDQEEHVKRISLIAWQNGAYCARWGNRQGSLDSTPPADGEVAELPPRPPLMAPSAHPALERYGIAWDGSPDKPLLTRMEDGYWTPWHVAVELLQRQALVPVAVSERLPGPGDCDAEGRCWWFVPASVLPNGTCPYWCLAPAESPRSWFTHWLPAHALPLPEVNNG